MKTKKLKIKFAKNFNGETGSVFTINFERLRELLEAKNGFKIEGFTLTNDGIDVFIDKIVCVGNKIKIDGEV